MNKDKGRRNHKKSPADKSSGKQKALTEYQAAKKAHKNKSTTPEPFIPRSDKDN